MRRLLLIPLCVLLGQIIGCGAIQRGDIRWGAGEHLRQQPGIIEQVVEELACLAPVEQAPVARVLARIGRRSARIEAMDDGMPMSEAPDIANLPAVLAAQSQAAATAGDRPDVGVIVGAVVDDVEVLGEAGFSLAESVAGILTGLGVTGGLAAGVLKYRKKFKAGVETARGLQDEATAFQKALQAIVGAIQSFKGASPDAADDLTKIIGDQMKDDPASKLVVYRERVNGGDGG